MSQLQSFDLPALILGGLLAAGILTVGPHVQHFVHRRGQPGPDAPFTEWVSMWGHDKPPPPDQVHPGDVWTNDVGRYRMQDGRWNLMRDSRYLGLGLTDSPEVLEP